MFFRSDLNVDQGCYQSEPAVAPLLISYRVSALFGPARSSIQSPQVKLWPYLPCSVHRHMVSTRSAYLSSLPPKRKVVQKVIARSPPSRFPNTNCKYAGSVALVDSSSEGKERRLSSVTLDTRAKFSKAFIFATQYLALVGFIEPDSIWIRSMTTRVPCGRR